MKSLFFRIFLACGVIFHSLYPTYAKAAKLPEKGSLIRDAEIEATLRSYIEPLFKAAGLKPENLRFFLINDPDLNAAATTSYTIFMNTGLLMKAKNVGQVIGVLAHETGHIADGHLMGREQAAKKATLAAMAAMILGGAAAVAGGRGDVGAGIMMGGYQTALQNFLHYSRGQEAAADQAGVRFLDKLGWSSQGLSDFMKVLQQQELLSSDQQDAYLRTHPLTTERVDFLENYTEKSAYKAAAFPEAFEDYFRRAQVKLKAFLRPPLTTLSEYPKRDQSLLGTYARAIAYHQGGQFADALKEVEGLLAQHPKDPYFWDLKGQILFENGKVQDSFKAYEEALKLAPHEPLIRLALASCLLEMGEDSSLMKKAIEHLEKVVQIEKENPFAWHQLAVAYGRIKDMGAMALYLAEEAYSIGNYKTAAEQAKRALHFLKETQKGKKLRASDIKEESERRLQEKGGWNQDS